MQGGKPHKHYGLVEDDQAESACMCSSEVLNSVTIMRRCASTCRGWRSPWGSGWPPSWGGISPAKQARLLGRQPQVIVATPGRLWELMRLGEPHLADLSQVAFLVLDEADRMVQQGHFQVMP